MPEKNKQETHPRGRGPPLIPERAGILHHGRRQPVVVVAEADGTWRRRGRHGVVVLPDGVLRQVRGDDGVADTVVSCCRRSISGSHTSKQLGRRDDLQTLVLGRDRDGIENLARHLQCRWIRCGLRMSQRTVKIQVG